MFDFLFTVRQRRDPYQYRARRPMARHQLLAHAAFFGAIVLYFVLTTSYAKTWPLVLLFGALSVAYIWKAISLHMSLNSPTAEQRQYTTLALKVDATLPALCVRCGSGTERVETITEKRRPPAGAAAAGTAGTAGTVEELELHLPVCHSCHRKVPKLLDVDFSARTMSFSVGEDFAKAMGVKPKRKPKPKRAKLAAGKGLSPATPSKES